MVLTVDSIKEAFAPLADGNAPAFFFGAVAPDVEWTFAPGATHELAGTYKGVEPFMYGVLGRMAPMFSVPTLITVQNVLVDASGQSAAVQLVSVGEAKSGKTFEDHACWIVTEKDGKLAKITSYINSALLLQLIEENREHFKAA